jgi:hypothetical protein
VGVNHGGESALFATATPGVAALEAKPAGVVSFGPYCAFGVFPVPTLFLVGGKGDVYAMVKCQAMIKGSSDRRPPIGSGRRAN